MLSIGFNFWSEWELQEKVDFDGINKLIIVYPNVTTLSIREDVWSAWIRWDAILNRNYNRFKPAMERTGLDVTPIGQLGNFVFLVNGWKLLIDLSKVKIDGVLFSRDFDTAYYTSDLVPQYPAEVSTVVNETTVTELVISATKEAIAEEVWTSVVRTLTDQVGITTEQAIQLKDIHLAETGRRKSVGYVDTIYEDDGVTPRKVFDITKNGSGEVTEISPR